MLRRGETHGDNDSPCDHQTWHGKEAAINRDLSAAGGEPSGDATGKRPFPCLRLPSCAEGQLQSPIGLKKA